MHILVVKAKLMNKTRVFFKYV